MEDGIEINDVYAAAYIMYHRHEPKFRAFGRHLTFIFPATEEIRQLLDEFHRQDKSIPARSYSAALRKTRGYLTAFKLGNLDL